MHALRILLFTIALMAARSVLASPGYSNTEGLALLSEYNAAFNRHDCQALIRMMSPALASRLDQGIGGKEAFCDFIEQMASERVVDKLGPIVERHYDKNFALLFVKNQRRSFVQPNRSITTSGLYALHSADAGKSWFVLDLGCLSPEWITDVYPSYKGKLPWKN